MRVGSLSRAERALLVALVAWVLVPLALMIVHALDAHLQLTGADGPIGADQLQYLAWVRDAGDHVLASNLFELTPTAHVFLQPMFTISGILWRVGLPLALAYLLWTPVAVGVLFAGASAWCGRLLGDDSRSRSAALALALFFISPVASLALWFSLGSAATRAGLQQFGGELAPAAQLWGYLPSVIAIGLMPIVLLALERVQRAERIRDAPRSAVLAALTAALVAWLHPWQGAVLLGVLAVLAAWDRLRSWRLFALAGLACALPLAYYLLLSKYDSAWRLGAHAELAPHLPAAAILIGLLPPLLLAGAGVQRRCDTLAERALIAWLPIAVAVYFALGSFPSHALEGLSLPLAVLIVRGWRRLGLGAIAGCAALAIATLPGLAYEARGFWNVANGPTQRYYLTASEVHALSWITADAPPGGVLSDVLFADVIPSQTGRRVWVGHQFWSRDYLPRAREADALLDGTLSASEARAVVVRSGVRLVVADCRHRADLFRQLGALLASVHRFGCATVYVVRRTGG